MIRARIRVGGRFAGGLQALLGAPLAVCGGSGERDGWIGRGKSLSQTGRARVGGDVRLSVGWLRHRRSRQAGSGTARSRARARLNWASQGQRWERCKVRRRADRVSRPAILSPFAYSAISALILGTRDTRDLRHNGDPVWIVRRREAGTRVGDGGSSPARR